MSQARKTVAPPTEARKELDLEISDLQGRLHDSVTQWHALVIAAETICGLTDFSARGVGLLRALLSTVTQSATATLELSGNLQQAIRAREEA